MNKNLQTNNLWLNFKKYMKINFNKKNNLVRLCSFLIASIIVIIPSTIMYCWAIDQIQLQPFGTNSFWYIKLALNNGVGFSILGNSPVWVVFLVQISINLVILLILLFMKKWYIIGFLSLAFMGGTFNIIDRAIDQPMACVELTNYHAAVVDYFAFGFMDFAIFNFPDMFIVIGTFGFIISFVTDAIVTFVKEGKKEKKEKQENEKNNR